MSTNRIINHPGIISGLFEATADSELNVVRGNQYGVVTTPSFFSCAGVSGDKEIDFEVNLASNTSIHNTLEEGYIYSLTGGQMIAPNDGSPPTITYSHDSLTRLGRASDLSLDLTNKTGVVGLGSVIQRTEIPNPNSEEENQLEVIVSHTNWDPQNRTHRPFVMKYIIPSTKNMVKTHSLYVVGREVSIVGQLVDWDIRNKMAVMLVGGVSVTSGHQNPKTSPKGASGPVTPGGRGRKLHQWSKESAVPPTPTPTPTPSGSSISPSLNPSVKGKGKAVLEPEAEEYVEEEVDDNDEEDEMPVLKKRGRPRKEILKDAAKRLKNP